MDCDDVMLVLAARERTLTGDEQTHLQRHLAECASCRALSAETDERWRWVVRIPADALDESHPVLPVVDPIVFEVGEELASGGMGRITRAHDRRLGREVAIKEVLAPEMRARFEREATITARLQHPAIVPIYEAGAWPNGSMFYTMRLVDGGTLAHAIAKATTMPARVALMPHVIAATEALAYAHSRRIIHRDVKPGNVLVGSFGETVVIDWGLAKELDHPSATLRVAARPGEAGAFDRPRDDAQLPRIVRVSAEAGTDALTRAGSVLGTPGFMPPEQLNGEELDERADVYALGAILYNLLAGVPPYFDSFASGDRLIEVGKREPPTPIAKLAPEAPEDLRAIVERAMARDKTARYRDAREMADELRRFAAGQLIAARAYTMRDLIARWIRRHLAAVVVATIATLALVAIAVLAIVNVTRSRESERVAREASDQTTAALLEEQGRTEILAGDRDRALAYLSEAYRRGRDTPALHYLLGDATRDLDPLRNVIAPPQLTTVCGDDKNCSGSDVASLGYTADGRLVVVEETGRISIWKDGAQLRAIPLAGGKHKAFGAALLDPAAANAAIARGKTLAMWDVEHGTERWQVDAPDLDMGKLVFDPSGAQLVALPDDDAAHDAPVFDAATGAKLATLELGGTHVTHAAFAPTGHRLAACGADGRVRVWDTRTFAPIATWQGPKDPPALAFAGDDRVIVGGESAEVWRIADAKRLHVLPGHQGHRYGLFMAIASDGELIATGDETAVRLWSSTGELLAETREIRGRMDYLIFAAGGALVGAGLDSRIYVWDTPTLERRAAIPAHDGWADQIAVSPTKIATSGLSDQRVREWAMPVGHRIARVPTRGAVLAGDRFVSVTEEAGTIVGRIDTGAEIRRLDVMGAPGDIKSIVLATRDGKRVLIAAKDNATIVDLTTTAPPRKLAWKGYRIALSPDGRYVVDAGDEDNGKHFAQVLDAGTGALVFELKFGKRDEPAGVDISPDGERLAIGFTGAIKQWRIPSGVLVSTLALPGIKDAEYRPQFAPSGATYAITSQWLPSTVLVYDAVTGASISKIEDSQEIGEPVFSRDGRFVLTATERFVRLWDARTGKQLASFAGTSADAYAFSADGARIATGSGDGTVRLWDTESGRQLARFRAHRDAIESLELSDDGTRLLAVGKDGYATLWDIHLDRRMPDAIDALAARGAWRFENGLLKPR